MKRLGIISILVVYGFGLALCTNQVTTRAVPSLQFASGFEGTTHITGNISTTSSQDGWIEGYDGALGDWSALKAGTYSNLSWVHQAYGWFQGGRMEIVQDPTNPNNHVLRLRNTNVIAGTSRAQWQLNQPSLFWNDNGLPNQFTQQFYRYRMYIPGDIKRAVSYSSHAPWYMIWESHVWPQFSGGELTRHGIYLQKNDNSSLWYFNVLQERPEGCHYYEGPGPACVVYWDNKAQHDIEVPFDEWFTFEVFFRYSRTDGAFYVAITRDNQERQVVADYHGQTQWDEKLHDQMIIKLYHDGAYLSALGETMQYYDDLEIWSDYPPGYFETTPLCYEITRGTGVRPVNSLWSSSDFYLMPGDIARPEYTTPNEDPPNAPYPVPATFACFNSRSCFVIRYREQNYVKPCSE